MNILAFLIVWCAAAGLAGAALGYLGYRADRSRNDAPMTPPTTHAGDRQ